MANLKVLLVVCAVVASALALGNVEFPPQPPSGNGTTPAPSPEPPTTPTPAPNTTTSVPPTPPPNTTTSVPPTPPPSPNTTTTAPITTVKPTPKPTPTPTPGAPDVGNWTVDYASSNRSCIIFQIAVQFEVLGNDAVKINLPQNATSAGSCEGEKKQNLKLSWGQNDSLEFDFTKSNDSKFDIAEISTVLNSGGKVYTLVHQKSEFSTPSANSYKCTREQSLNLTEANSNLTVAYLHVSHLQYQAFHNTTTNKFDSVLDCEGSVTPDIVPIVVGCVLAALVIVVLVAYLVGRRRCQARGYLSM